MFWKKNASGNKLPSPKEIPEVVGRYIIVNLGKNPDWVWSLKATLRPKEKEKDCFEFRVFESSQADKLKIRVQDFNSLTPHPELILYEGWFNKKTYEAKIESKTQLFK